MKKLFAIIAICLFVNVSGVFAADPMPRAAMEKFKKLIAEENAWNDIEFEKRTDDHYNIYIKGQYTNMSLTAKDTEEIQEYLDEHNSKIEKSRGDMCTINTFGRTPKGDPLAIEVCMNGYSYMLLGNTFIQTQVNGMTGPKLKECSCR